MLFFFHEKALKGNSKHFGSCREKAAGESLCRRSAEPLPEPWAETVSGRQVSFTGFSRHRERYWTEKVLYHERGKVLRNASIECFRIQVVPRIVQSALNIPALGCGEEMFRAFSVFIIVHAA